MSAADLARNKAVFQNLHLGTRCHQGATTTTQRVGRGNGGPHQLYICNSLLKWLLREHSFLTALTWLGAGCTAYCPTGSRHHDRPRLSKRRKTCNQSKDLDLVRGQKKVLRPKMQDLPLVMVAGNRHSQRGVQDAGPGVMDLTLAGNVAGRFPAVHLSASQRQGEALNGPSLIPTRLLLVISGAC